MRRNKMIENYIQERVKPYNSNLLPENFKYPLLYLRVIDNLRDISSIQYFSWEFINDPCGDDLDYKLRKNKFPEYDCIPFARNFDWIASFVGVDKTGNPRVFVLDLGNFENKIMYSDFGSWLEAEKIEAIRLGV